MLGFPPAHAQPHRCLFRSVGIARGNVDVYARVLHLRGIVLQVSVVVHTKNTFVFVVGPLVLGYIPLTRNTTNQSAPFPTPPLNHARPSMHLSWRMHGWLCDLISLPRYSSSERKSCDPPHNRHAVRGFYGGGNEGVAHHPFQPSLRIASTLSASLEMFARPAFRYVSLQGRTR